MVVRFRKKSRGMRGSMTHGYGSKKKHRGKGSKGGKGFAGSTKHKKQMVLAKNPDHFGHTGFHPLGKTENKIINIGDLENLARGKNEINLEELGYQKLLGNGEISSPLTIHVAQSSKSAKEKIEKAGGKIVE